MCFAVTQTEDTLVLDIFNQYCQVPLKYCEAGFWSIFLHVTVVQTSTHTILLYYMIKKYCR